MSTAAIRQHLGEDHQAILARHQQVKAAIFAEPDRVKVVSLCQAALAALAAHMDEENALMVDLGYDAVMRKRHVDHHRMIIAYLTHELERLEEDEIDGRQAITLADEWLHSHAVLFDNAFTEFLQAQGSTTVLRSRNAAASG